MKYQREYRSSSDSVWPLRRACGEPWHKEASPKCNQSGHNPDLVLPRLRGVT